VLLRRVDDAIKVEVIHWAAFYDHRMELGSKPIFHIEAFVAKFMAMSAAHRHSVASLPISFTCLSASPPLSFSACLQLQAVLG
jgi:hypothetical protein